MEISLQKLFGDNVVQYPKQELHYHISIIFLPFPLLTGLFN